jgi:hypothetical protein
MQPNYQEEIRKLLDEEGLINKTLSFGCVIRCKERLDTCTHYFDAIVIENYTETIGKLVVSGCSSLAEDVRLGSFIKAEQIDKIL